MIDIRGSCFCGDQSIHKNHDIFSMHATISHYVIVCVCEYVYNTHEQTMGVYIGLRMGARVKNGWYSVIQQKPSGYLYTGHFQQLCKGDSICHLEIPPCTNCLIMPV